MITATKRTPPTSPSLEDIRYELLLSVNTPVNDAVLGRHMSAIVLRTESEYGYTSGTVEFTETFDVTIAGQQQVLNRYPVTAVTASADYTSAIDSEHGIAYVTPTSDGPLSVSYTAGAATIDSRIARAMIREIGNRLSADYDPTIDLLRQDLDDTIFGLIRIFPLCL